MLALAFHSEQNIRAILRRATYIIHSRWNRGKYLHIYALATSPKCRNSRSDIRFQVLHTYDNQGCIFRLTCSHPELIEDHVLTSAYVKICRTVTRNAVNKSVWRKKYCSWLPLNKYAVNIWLSFLRIRAHLSWRTGKHLHVLHVLQTYSTCSYPGY